MSLAEAMKGGPPSRTSPSTRLAFPETIRDSLPDEEYETLTEMLHDRAWTPATIAALLYQHHGITVGVTTIRDYRRRSALTQGS